MDINDSTPGSRPRRKKRSTRAMYLSLFLLLVIAAAAFFLWFQKDPRLAFDNLRQKTGVETTLQEQPADDGSASGQGKESTADSSLTIDEVTVIPDSTEDESKEGEEDETQATQTCARETAKIESFYSHLDQQPYMQTFNLPQPSKEYFTSLIHRLAAQPPVVTRETDDLFTILKNTAHFFRIIGKDNILLIKGILDQEKDSFEEILGALYALTDKPDCLKTKLGLDVPASVFYDYSGFFLNTMGGRLYLFRRDSMSRMVVNYYAIRLIDRSNQAGTNSHGIDIRPAITLLIEEIENSGNRLRLKEEYLEELYALQEKYPAETEQ
jgi:hypothetical protein